MKERMLSERIRKKRKEKGLNQLDLADILGLSEMTIRRWENGKVSPRIEEIEKTAEVLNTSVEYLMGFSDNDNMRIDNDHIQALKQVFEKVDELRSSPPETPQISLPINNMEKENKISNDDLDLSYWGGVVERAKRASKSGDQQTIAAISLMLRMAVDAITGSEAKPTEERGANIHADIIDNSGNVKQTI